MSKKEYIDITVNELMEMGYAGIIPVEYVSVWDGGFEIVTKALFNVEENKVFEIEIAECVDDDGDEVEQLDGEFINLPNGTRLMVEDLQVVAIEKDVQ